MYEGDWKEDMKSGQGELKYSEGSRYVGSWDKDVVNGYGEITYSQG